MWQRYRIFLTRDFVSRLMRLRVSVSAKGRPGLQGHPYPFQVINFGRKVLLPRRYVSGNAVCQVADAYSPHENVSKIIEKQP
jgi:hypothetical protein